MNKKRTWTLDELRETARWTGRMAGWLVWPSTTLAAIGVYALARSLGASVTAAVALAAIESGVLVVVVACAGVCTYCLGQHAAMESGGLSSITTSREPAP